MIELKIIPDGGQIPYELTDDQIIKDLLQAASNIPDDPNAPISNWHDVGRVIPGSKNYIALRVPGEPPDYPGDSLNIIGNAITNNINGVKKHPNGWEYIPDR